MEPVNLSEVVAKTDIEMNRLGWNGERGRDYLIKTYGKRSRHLLMEEELLEHRFSNQKPNPPAPFPGREGGAKIPSPRRRGVGGEVLSRLLNWCSRFSQIP